MKKIADAMDNQSPNTKSIMPSSKLFEYIRQKPDGYKFPSHPVFISQVEMKLPSIMLPCRLTQALSILT
jgi:hypothetical protein